MNMELQEWQKRRALQSFAKAHPRIAFERLPGWARVLLTLAGCALALAGAWAWYVLLWAVFPHAW